MSRNFTNILPLILAHEGGYVNHPRDPGGATNKGVTQVVYNNYRTNKGLPTRSVRSITVAELEDIYRRQYWDRVRGEDLPAGIDYAVFDYGVNSGPGRAIKDLQRVIGCKLIDGQIGEETIRLTNAAADTNEIKLIEDYCNRRMRFLRGLGTWGTFGLGWKRRVIGDFDGAQDSDYGVIDYATKMAQDDLQFPIPQRELPRAIGAKEGEENGKGAESDVAVTKTKPGVGAIMAAAGTTGQTVIGAAQQVQPHISDTLFGKVAFVVFLLMMLGGAGLLMWSFYQRLKEKGAI